MRRLLERTELELEESRSAVERMVDGTTDGTTDAKGGGREATSTGYIMDGVGDDAKDCNWESCFKFRANAVILSVGYAIGIGISSMMVA